MKIATWNLNSVKARLEILLNWLKDEQPDVVLLQELKCQTEAFPFQYIEDLGYNIAVQGQKTYNGVAILSKYPLSDIIVNFPDNPIPNEARYIEAIVNLRHSALRVASVYVPNGQEVFTDKYNVKIKFLTALSDYYKFLRDVEENLLIGGDFNIALNDIDVYNASRLENSICFSLEERQVLRKFLSIGLNDCFRSLNIKEEGFTWWDYRANAFNKNHGMRIDYIFCSAKLMQNIERCFVSKSLREVEKASDHIPVSIILNDAF